MESSPSSSSSSSLSSSSGSDAGGGGAVTWFGMSFPFRSPLSLVMDYCTREDSAEPVIIIPRTRPRFQAPTESSASVSASDSGDNACGGAEEVAIRIIGAGEQESGSSPSSSRSRAGEQGCEEAAVVGRSGMLSSEARRRMAEERVPLVSLDDEIGGGRDSSSSSSTYQRYDIQQVAKWIEQILPFSLLLLIVFIRQHLQGFFVTICISAVMFKSNEIVKKQTALKGDRKVSVLLGISFAFMLHVICIYWWYRNDDLLYPLAMLPPKTSPPFWHTIFIILVNDTLVRQAAMALKCLLLIYYKNGRGHNFRRQGQMLTLIEYTLLLYRALLPTPVWYRFFLNKDYGSLFSSLTTGLYLTFKLTSVVEKVQCFVSALKALSKKEVHYGVYATTEQVSAAGDMCAICQEKMQTPILLSCKHMFCEECVSEWFERERTCPLCRALVKPADLRTFGDGSTSLFFQLF
ncbi:RING finger and transmembrane domain-containing protein 1 [Vigna radiata var. radiata]|uniref:RING finger and transmembrane domain-containing protein 1 n=1 Tax=Vigna radiata var. radiata TaxID=3916 RepID=A0A1S3U6Z5_VIGRR|nr:RING finger and transmembrane domain-containing protein 1 [Vigna radiata var. radiata]